jgi:hypothetical protein
VVDERADVVGHRLQADRSVDVRRSTMSLEIRRDHLVVRGERGDVRPEHLA